MTRDEQHDLRLGQVRFAVDRTRMSVGSVRLTSSIVLTLTAALTLR